MNGEIASKLRLLGKYALLLQKYKESGITELENDMTLRGAVERYMQLSIEIVIEIGEMIIAKEGFEKPETYRQVIEILGKKGIIELGFAKRFSAAAGFRNVLVHRYEDVDLEELYEHLQKDVGDFDVFSRQIAAYLKRK